MLNATLYIIVCSARNRARMRLRRMREPRYLLGAIAGVAYLVFALLIRERAYVARGGGQSAGPVAATAAGFVGPYLGGALLALLALASWALPFGSGLLDFSKAEASFLYPAPVTRCQLVFYRLMRSQYAVFIGALIMALAYPSASLPARLRGLLSVWVLLMTSHVFFTAVTLARPRLRQLRGWVVALPVLALSAGAVLSVIVPLWRGASTTPLHTVPAVLDAVVALTREGLASWLLWPFMLLIKPIYAQSAGEFVPAIAAAIGIYAFTVGWLVWADANAPDAADATVERQVNQPSALKRRYVARTVGWRLDPVGSAETAFVWKAVLQMTRTVDRRVLLRGLLILVWMVGASMFITRARGLVLLMGIFATWGALFSLFMAPQVMRMDLRQDLAYLELLKSWPVRGAAVIRGEIAWPTIVVTAITWLFGALAMVLSLISTSRIPTPNRLAIWLSFLILIPAIVLAQYLMHNAVAVVFPGWVPIGASRPRGVDAVGQRLILLAANWVGLLLALTPGLLLAAGLSALLRAIIGPVILPVGAALTSAIVVAEVWLATELLGPIYERMDITATERPD